MGELRELIPSLPLNADILLDDVRKQIIYLNPNPEGVYYFVEPYPETHHIDSEGV